ncbi:MAG: MmcB family DNA repair protein [Prolixibacteraceae bacterium]|nr:MmcB family DNA repair protein [Prolixibacteraceae bacterium]
MKITTLEMEECLARYFSYRRNLVIPNVSWGFNIHECDLLVVTKSGYLIEVEIKISKSDLKADMKKEHNHHDHYNRVKELYFAMPENLAEDKECIDLVPENAGIILVSKWKPNWHKDLFVQARTIRKSKVNKAAGKLYDNEKYQLARLGTMRIWSLKKKIIKITSHEN